MATSYLPTNRVSASRSPTRPRTATRLRQAVANSTACRVRSFATKSMITRILIDMPVHEQSLRELQSIDGIQVDLLPPQEVSPQTQAADVAPDILSATSVLFCTMPPANFAAMRKLRWIQIASAGYSQLFGLN